MAAIPEAPTLFLRKATGLVKGWLKFDAFLYSFMSVNFVTLGLFFSLSVLGFVPDGQVLPALLLSGVFLSFLVVTGWWFILWYWAPVYANILTVEVFQPLAAVLKLEGLSDFLANKNGLFI